MYTELVRQFAPHSRLIRAWTLTGGVSAQVTALEIEHADGRRQQVVVRQHGKADLARDPDLVQHEFDLLRVLQIAGLPVPEPIHAGDALVIAYVDGKPDFTPPDTRAYMTELATLLARIHQADTSALTFLQGEGCLLHGDFWTGNVLCNAGRVVAVIDWEDARLGDPLADLANSRLEMLWAFGWEAMHHFTRHYLTCQPSVNPVELPRHDLRVAERVAPKLGGWGLSPEKEATMRRRLQDFVHQAMMLV